MRCILLKALPHGCLCNLGGWIKRSPPSP